MFLDGHTAVGTRPADVVDSSYRHPFGTQYTSHGQPLIISPSFPAYSIPPRTLSTTLSDLATLSVASVGEDLYSDDSDVEIGATPENNIGQLRRLDMDMELQARGWTKLMS